MHPRVRLLRKHVDEHVEAAGKTLKRKSRTIEKQTGKIARRAVVGELAELAASGISKKDIFNSILPQASSGKKKKASAALKPATKKKEFSDSEPKTYIHILQAGI